MNPEIAAIIPAAGSSRRMGRPKQLLPLSGRPLVNFAVERLRSAGIEEIILVVGCYKNEILKSVRGLDVKTAENHLPDSHMIDSVRAGLDQVSSRVSGLMILPVDSCLASVHTLRALMKIHAADPLKFIRPHSGTGGGHPLIVPEKYIEDIRGRKLQSLRHLLRKKKDLINMHCTDPGAFLDLDTAADYEKALNIMLS